MNKIFLLIPILLVSAIWQPVHKFYMFSGMSMSPEIHSIVTMLPFLAVLLLLVKTN